MRQPYAIVHGTRRSSSGPGRSRARPNGILSPKCVGLVVFGEFPPVLLYVLHILPVAFFEHRFEVDDPQLEIADELAIDDCERGILVVHNGRQDHMSTCSFQDMDSVIPISEESVVVIGIHQHTGVHLLPGAIHHQYHHTSSTSLLIVSISGCRGVSCSQPWTGSLDGQG